MTDTPARVVTVDLEDARERLARQLSAAPWDTLPAHARELLRVEADRFLQPVRAAARPTLPVPDGDPLLRVLATHEYEGAYLTGWRYVPECSCGWTGDGYVSDRSRSTGRETWYRHLAAEIRDALDLDDLDDPDDEPGEPCDNCGGRGGWGREVEDATGRMVDVDVECRACDGSGRIA